MPEVTRLLGQDSGLGCHITGTIPSPITLVCIVQLRNMDSSDWRRREQTRGDQRSRQRAGKEGCEGATQHY